MNDLIKRLREMTRTMEADADVFDDAADKLEEQALSLGVERAWIEKLEKDLAAAKKTAYKTAVSDFCIQFGVKTVEELEHKIERLESELEGKK